MRKENYVVTSEGLKMPRIIYGTAWKKERTTELVIKAVESGFRAIDTACQPKHYFEKGVGEALLELKERGFKREDLFIQTKFTPEAGQDPHNIPYDPALPLEQQVFDSFEVSKQNLKTDYIDSLVLHSPLFPYSDTLKVYRAFEKLYKNKEVRQLGISNCYDLQTLKHLYEDAEIKPAVIQNRFYDESNYDKEIRAWCKDHNVIYQSFWSLTANPHILASDIIKELAVKYKKTEAQIFFAFLLSLGIVPLSGTTSESHMKEDIQIFDIELGDDETRIIEKYLYM